MLLNDVESVKQALREFAKDRDWDQFHSPKNLTMALAGEVGELMEHFQWLTEEQSFIPKEAKKHQDVQHELADIFLYLVRIADKLDIDLLQASAEKIKINEDKYPIKDSYGNAKKYTEYK